MNVNLDFISHPQFRQSLEADYSDLLRCFDTKAWKSVSVLAGSMVEALLVDYLVATYDTRSGKDPLKMDLAEAVGVCKLEGVLSERTADLCSVVRSYRNLIHPGRVVRLGEAAPSEASAKIALALVDLIVEEVASKRKAAFGLTGEQVVSKVDRDPNCIPFLQPLIAEAGQREKRRLLLDLIPSRYLAVASQEELSVEEVALLQRLSQAFRIVRDASDDQCRLDIAARFVSLVKSADGQTLSTYAVAFFRASDIETIPEPQRALVKQFLLASMSPVLDAQRLEMISGIEQYLEAAEASRWLDPIVKTLTSSASATYVKDAVRQYYTQSLWGTSVDVDRAVLHRLQAWESSFRARSATAALEVIEQLKSDVPPLPADDEEDDDLPF